MRLCGCMDKKAQASHTTETETECRALTRASFAKRWEISERYVSILISENILPSVKLGRRCIRVPTAEGDAALLNYMQHGLGEAK